MAPRDLTSFLEGGFIFISEAEGWPVTSGILSSACVSEKHCGLAEPGPEARPSAGGPGGVRLLERLAPTGSSGPGTVSSPHHPGLGCAGSLGRRGLGTSCWGQAQDTNRRWQRPASRQRNSMLFRDWLAKEIFSPDAFGAQGRDEGAARGRG